MYLSPVCLVPCRLVYSLFPVCLPCLVYPWCCHWRLLFWSTSSSACSSSLPAVCTRDRRPDPNSKRRPFTSFCFVHFFKCFVCSWVLSLAASESARREPLCPPFAGVYAAVRGSPILRFAGVYAAVRGSHIPPFAGVDAAVRGSAIPPFAGVHAAVRGSSSPQFPGDDASIHG